jgi:GNAT superfamily N-acetyltransferase
MRILLAAICAGPGKRGTGPLKEALRITVATMADAEAVGSLLEASYPKLMAAAYDPAILAAALPLMTRPNPALLRSGSYFLAFGPQDRLLGCGGWTSERPGGGEREPGLGHVRHFAVHPDAAGKGIGRALLECCFADAARQGMAAMECYSSLNGFGFYQHLGFSTIEAIEPKLGGTVTFPSVRMRCEPIPIPS